MIIGPAFVIYYRHEHPLPTTLWQAIAWAFLAIGVMGGFILFAYIYDRWPKAEHYEYERELQRSRDT